MKVFSIDVGIVNMGVACIGDGGKIVYADKVQLHPKGAGKGKMKEYDVAEKVNQMFFLNPHINKYIQSVDIVVIENQMSRKNLIIQHNIAGNLCGRGIPYAFVRPHDVKRFYNISTGAYRTNKKAAIETCRRLYPHVLENVDSKKHDDISDAVLQGMYYHLARSGVVATNTAVAKTVGVKRKQNTKQNTKQSKTKQNTKQSKTKQNTKQSKTKQNTKQNTMRDMKQPTSHPATQKRTRDHIVAPGGVVNGGRTSLNVRKKRKE